MPESAAPFISRQDLVDRMGRGTVTDDGMLSAVDAACDIVRTLSEQTFNAGTTTLTVDGTGTDAIVLPELPVTAVGTVNLISTTGGSTAVTDYALNGNGVLLRTRGSVDEDLTAFPAWPLGRQNVEITYEHGYSPDTLPRDVREVALSLAQRLVIQGPAVFEVQGQEQIRYGLNSTDLSEGEKAILQKYRQR